MGSQKRLLTKMEESAETIVKNKKIRIDKSLFRQPTVEELNQLRETENLFHSNLFRLQIDEILAEVKIKDKHQRLFDNWLQKLKDFFNSLQESPEIDLNQEVFLSDIQIPMCEVPNKFNGTFQFSRPSRIEVIGSYAYGTCVGSSYVVDLYVEVPRNSLKKSDIKNYIYLKKKAMYLAYLASKLDIDLIENKAFVGSIRKPVLKVVPSGKVGKRFVVFLHVGIQEDTFDIKKLSPGRNNIKLQWCYENCDSSEIEFSPIPTPYYNTYILSDLTLLKNNENIAKILKEYPNVQDGIILLKIWLKQRDLGGNFFTFNGYVITLFVLYLLQQKKLNTFMSSYQIVRNTWQFLSQSNWCKKGISLCQDQVMKERILEFHKFFSCVLIDYSGYCNTAADITEDEFSWISSQAQVSLSCLDNTETNSFQLLFMRKIPFYYSFDHIICFHAMEAFKNVINKKLSVNKKFNIDSDKFIEGIKMIINLLKKGLGNRITLMCHLPLKLLEWKISEKRQFDYDKLHIGIQLNPEFAYNIIDRGPGANLPDAEEFRKFWGPKSELRRFKDGSICEAILWSKGKSISDKRQITKVIVKYLLNEKLQLFENSHYFYAADQVEEYLNLKKLNITHFKYGLEEASLNVIRVFQSLEKELTSLINLPLSINGIHGYSPVLRYTDVFPPLATVHKPDNKIVMEKNNNLVFKDNFVAQVPIYLPSVEANIQLSTSGKWPDSIGAFSKTKTAFYIQIAECLRQQYKLKAQGNKDCVIIFKEGFLFRLRIAHQKEISLIKQQIGDDGVIKFSDSAESLKLEKLYIHLPKISGALHGLHCQQASFGPACCLAKRWLCSQMIDYHYIPEIAIELLMASIYLSPNPYNAAQTPQVAFFRFLDYFALESWVTDPVIINFNDEMTKEEIIEIKNFYQTSRESLPNVFISTPYDRKGSIWTKDAPKILILNRIAALAKESLKYVRHQFFMSKDLNLNIIFTPPLTEYDCLIKLKLEYNSRKFESINSGNLKMTNLHPYKDHSSQKIPIHDFNPVEKYLNELRKNYSDFALFFHDTFGGSIIGVLVKPDSFNDKMFKVPNTNCSKLKNGSLEFNISAMIEDFYILGKQLVETIDVQSKRFSL